MTGPPRLRDLAQKTRQVAPEPESTARKSPLASSPGMEISLRGKLVEDGLDELERYLEKAYAAGLPFIRIVHGKGTGRMREAVRVALKSKPAGQLRTRRLKSAKAARASPLPTWWAANSSPSPAANGELLDLQLSARHPVLGTSPLPSQTSCYACTAGWRPP